MKTFVSFRLGIFCLLFVFTSGSQAADSIKLTLIEYAPLMGQN